MTTPKQKHKLTLSPKLKKVLRPLAYLWEKIYFFRRLSYQYGLFAQEKFRVPVISIGNISFGGTGKTPFTLWLADFLAEKSLSPCVLTRGYKGDLEHSAGLLKAQSQSTKNLNHINNAEGTPSPDIYYGDEPLLLARKLKSGGVIIGKKRAENLLFYFAQLRPDVVLLDDGHQHLRMARDFNILLFDATAPLASYQVAPCGFLREGLSAIASASAVVFGRCDQVTPEQLENLQSFLSPYFPPDILLASFRYRPTGLFNAHDEKILSPEDLSGKKILAVAALASPQSFFHSLTTLGAEVVYKMIFPDHHYFKDSDLDEILQKAHELAVESVIVSEKDMVKIRRISLDAKILYLGISIEFIKGEELLKEKLIHLVSQNP